MSTVQEHIDNPKLPYNVLFSGGAVGADTIFTECAVKAGHDCLNFHFKGGRMSDKIPEWTRNILSHDELKRADPALIKANKTLKRSFPTKNYGVNCLLRRNYYQIKNTNRVYAVAPINKDPNIGPVDTLLGGTSWAVVMAIDIGRERYEGREHVRLPVYVFDLHVNKWVEWNYDDSCWINTVPPKPTGKYTGIGSRTPGEQGEKAIKSLYI